MKTTDKEKVILFLFALGINKKDLIDAIASGSKLTKADAGRVIAILQKRKIINQVMYIDAGRMMATMTPQEFSVFLLGKKKIALIDAISMGAKLTKADAGRALDAALEAIQAKLKTVFGGKGQ